jgi:hypothetical protein
MGIYCEITSDRGPSVRLNQTVEKNTTPELVKNENEKNKDQVAIALFAVLIIGYGIMGILFPTGFMRSGGRGAL